MEKIFSIDLSFRHSDFIQAQVLLTRPALFGLCQSKDLDLVPGKQMCTILQMTFVGPDEEACLQKC